MAPTMLILRGISGTFAGKEYPRGALDEPSALEYARRLGYNGRVLDVSGETGPQSAQVRMALNVIEADKTVTALYGFSGGGYNLRHILNQLPASCLARIEKVIVLGAPKFSPGVYYNPWLGTELIYRLDPPEGHMAGPKALLASLDSPVPIA